MARKRQGRMRNGYGIAIEKLAIRGFAPVETHAIPRRKSCCRIAFLLLRHIKFARNRIGLTGFVIATG